MVWGVPLTFAAGGGTWVSEVPADSPLAWLRLNETSGSNAADSSGNSRPGTHVNVTASGSTGKGTDKAMSYPGGAALTSLDYAAIGTAFSTASTSVPETWALAVLFKRASIPGAAEYLMSVGGTGGNPIVGMNVLNTSGALRGVYRLDDGTTINNFGPATNYCDNAWHLVVFESDGANVNLYADGSQVATQAAVTGATATFTKASVGNLHRDVDSNGFTGLVDEAMFYDHALGATRVAALNTALSTI